MSGTVAIARCMRCGGRGFVESESPSEHWAAITSWRCHVCDGSGEVVLPEPPPPAPCTTCLGSGKTHWLAESWWDCPTCKGRGSV